MHLSCLWLCYILYRKPQLIKKLGRKNVIISGWACGSNDGRFFSGCTPTTDGRISTETEFGACFTGRSCRPNCFSDTIARLSCYPPCLSSCQRFWFCSSCMEAPLFFCLCRFHTLENTWVLWTARAQWHAFSWDKNRVEQFIFIKSIQSIFPQTSVPDTWIAVTLSTNLAQDLRFGKLFICNNDNPLNALLSVRRVVKVTLIE